MLLLKDFLLPVIIKHLQFVIYTRYHKQEAKDIPPTAAKIKGPSVWCHYNGVKYDLKMIMMSEILKIIKIHKDFYMNYST